MEWIVIVLVSAVKMGTPILFGTLGGVISERAGVINLGMEGLMLIGALTSFVVKLYTGSTILAVSAAAFVAGAATFLHALVCISMRASQIASGLALTMFGTGVSGLLGDSLTGKTVAPLMDIKLPILSSIPLIGKIFFMQDALVYFSYISVAVIWYLLFYTRIGLNIRSMGEAPEVCDSIGLSVMKYRYAAVIIGGMMVGIGGAYFPMVLTSFWVDNLTAGRGWIAVALVIFAFWHPGKAMFGAYLFGAAISLQLRLQLIDIKISPYFLAMFPFILTIIALIIATIRNNKKKIAVMPASLGEAFFRGEKH
ncbi:MAG: ABC transporter permease [Deltaproteobacteria bacterium]|nr:ABC transporter permease [Deltaproteobacteria bacterium]